MATDSPTASFEDALEGLPFRYLKEVAREDGFPLYVIGGYVRDYFLNKAKKVDPKDIDVVTTGSGPDAAEAFAKRAGASKVVTFRNFGTAMVRLGDWEIEFVGARKESYARHSRKPNVTPGTLQDDQLRRDFTINALSLSLNPENYGDLIDPFRGLHDLKEGIIRTPRDPDITFSDDPLRMLRAVRFASRLQYRIAPETYQALRNNAARLEIVSKERIADEFNKILLTDKPSVGLLLLFKTGLLRYVLPELEAMQGVEEREGIRHKDNFYHTLKVVDNLAEKSENLWLRWAALLHDIGKPRTKRFQPGQGWTFHGHEDVGARMVPKIFRQLKLPMGTERKYVQKLVRLHQRPIALAGGEVTDSAIRRIVVEAGEELDDLLTLCRADITTRSQQRYQRYLANYAALEERIHHVLERDRLRNWQPPIGGQEIMETFNLKPSKVVGEIKNAIREAILEGEISNDPEAARWYMYHTARKILGKEHVPEIPTPPESISAQDVTDDSSQ